MRKAGIVELRSYKEINNMMNHYLLHNTRLLKFNEKRLELILGDLNKETIFRIFGCEEQFVKRFYPSYHKIKYDLEQLRIENKAEAYEFGIERKH